MSAAFPNTVSPLSPDHSSDARTLFDLLANYRGYEDRVADAIAQQNGIARTVMRRAVLPGTSEAGRQGTQAERRIIKPKMPFADFKSMVSSTQHLMQADLPMVTKRLIDGADRYEQNQITELDSEINVLKLQMHMVELDILDHSPRTPREALAKLRFLVALLLNSAEIDIDFFAYLVDECTDRLEAAQRTPMDFA